MGWKFAFFKTYDLRYTNLQESHVFVFFDSLCKFVIYSGHRSGEKKEQFWSLILLFLEECQTLTKADNDL